MAKKKIDPVDHKSQQKNRQIGSPGVDPINKKVEDNRSVQIKKNKKEVKAKTPAKTKPAPKPVVVKKKK